MTQAFDHFVITRFNLKQSIWELDKKGQSVNDLAWLQKRYELFERYCFPSLLNQTSKKFKWLVYFDIDTPEVFKIKNEQFRLSLPSFKPIYVANFKEFERILPDDIFKNKTKNNSYLITTRLDNDDCFHKDAIEIIQSCFKPINKGIIDLKNGLALQIYDEYKLSLKKNTTSGPFISLIESYKDSKKMLTIYEREHLKWRGDAEYINVNEGYYWLQIIHRNNLTNGLSNELTSDKKYLEGFSVHDSVKFSFRYRIFIVLKALGILAWIKKIKK